MDTYVENYINDSKLSTQIISELDILDNSSNPLLCILHIFALAEKATSESHNKPWLVSELLNKRRKKYEFDNNLQQMLFFVKNIGNFSACEMKCGTDSWFRTELTNEDGYSILFFNSFNPESNYVKQLIQKNSDYQNPKFAFFQYELDYQNKKVVSLKFVIPCQNVNIKDYRMIDVTDKYKLLKDSINNVSIENTLKKLKKSNSQNCVQEVT